MPSVPHRHPTLWITGSDLCQKWACKEAAVCLMHPTARSPAGFLLPARKTSGSFFILCPTSGLGTILNLSVGVAISRFLICRLGVCNCRWPSNRSVRANTISPDGNQIGIFFVEYSCSLHRAAMKTFSISPLMLCNAITIFLFTMSYKERSLEKHQSTWIIKTRKNYMMRAYQVCSSMYQSSEWESHALLSPYRLSAHCINQLSSRWWCYFNYFILWMLPGCTDPLWEKLL